MAGYVFGLVLHPTRDASEVVEIVERWATRHGKSLAVRAEDAVLDVDATVSADGRDVGRVTSAAGGVALALLGRAVEPGASVVVDDVPATVEAIP